MQRDSCDVVGDHLALAGMDAGAHLESDCARAGTDRERRPHRSGRTVEGCQHAVADPLHPPAAVARQLSLDQPPVLAEQLTPPTVPELGCAVGRSDDVGEEDRREHPVANRGRGTSRDELLDLVDHRVLISRDEQMVRARKLNLARARDPARDRAREVRTHDPILGAVEHKRRHAHSGQQRPHIQALRT